MVCRCAGSLLTIFRMSSNESHVQHPVGFIEHEKLDFAKAKRVALHEVEQAPGRGHEHFDPVEQRTDLGPHRDAADHQRAPDIQVTAVGVEAVEDLARKFARRTEHQRAAASCAPVAADRPPGDAGSAAQRPPSCRCRSARYRSRRGTTARLEWFEAGSELV